MTPTVKLTQGMISTQKNRLNQKKDHPPILKSSRVIHIQRYGLVAPLVVNSGTNLDQMINLDFIP